MSATSQLQRAALGRAKQIGALYDVRTDNFLNDSLFRRPLGADAVYRTDLGDTSIELVITDSVEEKFNKFDIEPELQASLLAGWVKLGGSCSYLVEDKKSSKAVRMSLIYKTKRASEGFELRHHRDVVDTDLFTQQGMLATHVVVGIEWGAACSITCECENTENKSDATVKGALKAELEKLKGLISAKGAISRDVMEKSEQTSMKFSFKCKSDVSSQDDLPDTFEGALQLAKSLPKLIQETNNGKGVPLVYSLKPLSEVVKICNLSISLEITFSLLKKATISATAHAVESITKKMQSMYDIKQVLDSFCKYVSDEKLKTVVKYTEEISIHSQTFQSDLQEIILKIRRREAELSVLDKFLSKTESLLKYDNYIRELQADLNKINFIKDCIKRGMVYVGKHDLLVTDDDQTVYIFYKPLVSNAEADEAQQFFLQLNKATFNPGNMAFKVVDEAVCPDIWSKSNAGGVIVVYENGVKTCADLYVKERKKELCNLSDELQSLKNANDAASTSQQQSKGDDSVTMNTKNTVPKSTEELHLCLLKLPDAIPSAFVPPERALVKLRCPNSFPGSRKCADCQLVWKCAECRCRVEYGLSTEVLYCRCGESIPSSASFRCSDSAHGTDYVSYPDGTLRKELSALRPMEEKVILLLGEAGVDKPTWINSFVNYLAYPKWDIAKQEQLYTLVSSSFTSISNESVDEIKISSDTRDGLFEVDEIGNVTSYGFQINGHKIRFVDTPNIGEAKDLHHDNLITGSIVDCLYKYEEIHAVCILLREVHPKPAMFRYSIQEMLKCFHRLALNNIVICNSNARIPFFLSSDSFKALTNILEQNTDLNMTPENCFCLDYAPFRKLAYFNNHEKDPRVYSESWSTAAAEANRLIDRVEEMRPHKVTESISVNEVRTVAEKLSESIIEEETRIQRGFSSGVSQTQTNVEIKTMSQALDKYASFLEDFAIVPYNDMVGEYFCMTVIDGDNVTNIQSKVDDQMKELFFAYKKAKKILESAKAGKGEMNSPADLLQYKTQLVSLRDYGREFKMAFARAPVLSNQI